MEKKNKNLKEDVATMGGSMLGSTAGVVAGNAISQKANAAETIEVEAVANEPAPTEAQAQHHHAPVEHHAQATPTPAPTVAPAPSQQMEAQVIEDSPSHDESTVATEAPIAEPQVEVISCDVVVNDDGHMMEVAEVSYGGNPVYVADINMDGEVNLIAADINGNGQFDEGEVINVTDQHLSMDPLHEAINMGDELADNSLIDQDYVNDANVDDYLA